VLSTVVQFAYTTLFGVYVGYLFLRTGVSHAMLSRLHSVYMLNC
jgi:hypothetical protein